MPLRPQLLFIARARAQLGGKGSGGGREAEVTVESKRYARSAYQDGQDGHTAGFREGQLRECRRHRPLAGSAVNI